MVKKMKTVQPGVGFGCTEFASPHAVGSDIFFSILDKDYEAIEGDFFGSRAIDCLSLSSESAAAPPQGSPFLRFAQPISSILRRYKGIYSI
jgi:hypothetical protein